MAIESQRKHDANVAKSPPVEGNKIRYKTDSNATNESQKENKGNMESLRRNDLYLEQCSAEQIDTIIR